MPRALRPFRTHIFGDTGQAVMNRLGVPKTLGRDNRELVAGSPLLLGVLLDRREYVEGALSGFYSVFGDGGGGREHLADHGDAGHGHPVRVDADGVPRGVGERLAVAGASRTTWP